MDVLNNIALPQSTEHFHLLLLVYNLVMIFVIPYLALVVGNVVLAAYFDRRGEKLQDPRLGSLARRLTGIALPDRSTFLFLALLPSAAVCFLFVQMFQDTTAIAAGIAAIGTLLLVAGGIAAFTFKLTFTINDIVSLAGRAQPPAGRDAVGSEVGSFLAATRATHRRAGKWASILLLVGAFCFVGASTIGMNPANWISIDGIFSFLISGGVWIDACMFLAAAAAMSGAGLLFGRFIWDQGSPVAEEEDDILHPVAVRLASCGILVLPLTLLANAALLPVGSLTGWVYVLVALSFGSLALGLHFLYGFVQSGRRLYASLLILTVFAALAFNVTKNQVALHTATADHAACLAGVYDRNTEELRTSLGVMAKQLTGEDIYNAKCSACHLFDQKKIGPPYREVIVKYAGRKPALVAFVLNPVKVNPAYPNMPSQGLRPSEADSIATYLLGKIVGKAQ
jgi:cytochrome c